MHLTCTYVEKFLQINIWVIKDALHGAEALHTVSTAVGPLPAERMILKVYLKLTKRIIKQSKIFKNALSSWETTSFSIMSEQILGPWREANWNKMAPALTCIMMDWARVLACTDPIFPTGLQKTVLFVTVALARILFPWGKGMVTVWIWSRRRRRENLAKFDVTGIGEENNGNAHRSRVGGGKRGRTQGTPQPLSWGSWKTLPRSTQLSGLRMNEQFLVG